MMNIIELAEEFDRLDKEPEFRAKIDEFNQRQRDMIDMLPKDIKRNIEILKTNDILLLELAEEFDRLDKDPKFSTQSAQLRRDGFRLDIFFKD